MPAEASPVKLLHAEINFRPAAISTDFVHGDERIVDIKRRVLETFRHDGSGELLPTHDEIEVPCPRRLQVPWRRQQQDAAKELESRAFARDGQRVLDVSAIGCRNGFIADIRSINGEACRHGYKRVLQFLCSEIPRMPVFL